MAAKKKKDARAADQATAIEVAFVEGTLPEEDRREPENGDNGFTLGGDHRGADIPYEPLPEAEGGPQKPGASTVLDERDEVDEDGRKIKVIAGMGRFVYSDQQ